MSFFWAVMEMVPTQVLMMAAQLCEYPGKHCVLGKSDVMVCESFVNKTVICIFKNL